MPVAHLRSALLIALCLGCLAGPVGARTIEQVHGFEPHFVLPPDSGMVSIKDYGAVGDGRTDDTAAFRKAVLDDAPRSIYIPAGTYLIRESLIYGLNSGKKKRVTLMGAGVSRTILKLADGSPGFGDPGKPKVFIATRPPRQQGEQNMHQYLYHLTIEIGRDNPGAVALNYHSNNTGAVKDVAIRASDPVDHPGHTGLALWDWEVGPANARYLTVEGFRTGIDMQKVGNYFVLEHVTVRHCQTGVSARTSSIRDLTTEHCPTPITVSGQVVLLDSTLDGSGPAAIVNKGSLLARNLETRGFTKAISSNSPRGDFTGPKVAEYTSHPVQCNQMPSASPTVSLNLPVEQSPELQYPQSDQDWAMMPLRGDITEAIQRAIDSGKTTIYLPAGGGTTISRTIHLRNKVERIMSVGVSMVKMATGDQPVFRLEDGVSPQVIIELIYANYGSSAAVGVEQASKRTLVVRHSSLSYRTAAAGHGGKLFMESVVSWVEATRVHAWLRDMDTEAGGLDARNIANDGGVMWVLGQKTEDFATKLKTRNGGFSELLGGTYRQNWDQSDFNRAGINDANRPPLFLVDNAHVSLTYLSWGPAKTFDVLVREVRDGQTRDLQRSSAGGGATLFLGYQATPQRQSLPSSRP